MMIAITITAALSFAGGAADVESAAPPSQNFVVFADSVYTSAGDVIAGGMVRVRDGKIRVVSKGEAGEDDLHVAAVTAGMIDLSGRILSRLAVEQSSEITPHVRATEAIDSTRRTRTSSEASPRSSRPVGHARLPRDW